MKSWNRLTPSLRSLGPSSYMCLQAEAVTAGEWRRGEWRRGLDKRYFISLSIYKIVDFLLSSLVVFAEQLQLYEILTVCINKGRE